MSIINSRNFDAFQFSNFSYKGSRFGQHLGRFEFTDQEGVIGNAHAIKITPGSILEPLLKTAIIGPLLTKILYGDYLYKNIDRKEFLISTKSVAGSILQQKVIKQIDQFKSSTLYKPSIIDAIESLRTSLLKNKDPFRKLASDESRMYQVKVPLAEAYLSLENQNPVLHLKSKHMGSGMQKEMYKAINISSCEKQAIFTTKSFPVPFIGDWWLRCEKRSYEELKQKGIGNIIGIDTLKYDENSKLMGVMRYCQGGHYKILGEPITKLKYLTSIAHTISLLHKEKIVHRDLKPQNVLIHNGQAYLADFGLTSHAGSLNIRGGTGKFMAPELLSSKFPLSFANQAHDAWALGIMLSDNISDLKASFKGDIDKQRLLNSLIKGLLETDPRTRTTVQEAYRVLQSLQRL